LRAGPPAREVRSVVRRTGWGGRGAREGAGRATSAREISAGLKRALSAREHRMLRLAGRLADEAGSAAYLVGGIVRDIALGYPDTDLDIVIEGRAEDVARALAGRLGGEVGSATAFGTCKVKAVGPGTVDIATARNETYDRPGALPRTHPSDLAHDLVRRDFTVNAMALALGPGVYGKLVDPCGGLKDLAAGKLRVMHDGSFVDDPTRMLRGVRFAARYGFGFERRTLALLRACLRQSGLATISGKRVFRELALICREPRVLDGLRLLARYGLLQPIVACGSGRRLPRGLWRKLPGAIAATRAAGVPEQEAWIAWLASLFADLDRREAARLASHFNLPREVREACLWAASDRKRAAGRLLRLSARRAYQARVLLDGVPPAGLVLLYASCPAKARGLVIRYLAAWRHVKPSLTGKDLAALGLAEGPAVGALLADIVRLKLAGQLRTRAAEIAYVRRRIGPGRPPATATR